MNDKTIPRYYITVDGDTLRGLAKHYYGAASLWVLLYEVNKEKIKDPDVLLPDQVLSIPYLAEDPPDHMNKPTTPTKQRQLYHLILAEVIFSTAAGGIGSHRVQLFAKDTTETFPAGRLKLLQNAAAAQAKRELGNDESFSAMEVLLLNFQSLGWMTDAEFNAEQLLPPKPTDPAGTNPDNVVNIHKP